MSDLGLLRSFRPVAQEALPQPGHTADLTRQLQDASAELERSSSAVDSDRLAKPEMPPYCRSVGMRERRPVRILWG